jgi:hypothetical protein
MSSLATAACTATGVALVIVVGRDVFDVLFHPEGRGTVSRLLTRGAWTALRRPTGRWPALVPLAGPLILVLVIASWAVLLATGWALVFVPHVDDGFRLAAGARPGAPDLVEALNLSLVTLTTVGSSDLAPDTDWLRIVTPLEALLGFGLLSASISWLLLIHPVLSRRRSLAYEVFILTGAQRDSGVALEELDPAAVEDMLAELTSRLVAVERDMVSFPVTYYFRESDERFALAARAGDLLDLARWGARDDMPARVRLRGHMLLEALGDFAATTATRFHGRHAERLDDLLAAYASDHEHRPAAAGTGS